MLEVVCEDPQWTDDIKEYRVPGSGIGGRPGQMIRGNWADMAEEEQMSTAGRLLERAYVIEARMNGIDALKKMGVWKMVPMSQCIGKTGRRPIKARWADINKGENANRNYRSRCVAQAVRQAHGGARREGLFAAMPPIDVLKLIISRAATAGRA